MLDPRNEISIYRSLYSESAVTELSKVCTQEGLVLGVISGSFK